SKTGHADAQEHFERLPWGASAKERQPGGQPGEVYGVPREKGARKSTPIKILAGAYTPDQGEMTFDGAPARWSSPREAKRHGVHVVYQEFVLFPQLSVAENIFVGHELRNRFGIVDHARM